MSGQEDQPASIASKGESQPNLSKEVQSNKPVKTKSDQSRHGAPKTRRRANDQPRELRYPTNNQGHKQEEVGEGGKEVSATREGKGVDGEADKNESFRREGKPRSHKGSLETLGHADGRRGRELGDRPHGGPRGYPHRPGSLPTGPVRPMNTPQHRVIEANVPGRTSPLRILLLTHVQGRLGMINSLARSIKANIVINAGNFGFFDEKSYEVMSPKDMRQRISTSHVYNVNEEEKARALSMNDQDLMRFLKSRLLFSELPAYLHGTRSLDVPVYTIWGQQEDIRVVEKFKTSEYRVNNLHLLDERASHKIGNLRLLGLGGNVLLHKLFDSGMGEGDIAGVVGKMWTTLLQVADLIQTAKATYDPSETRLFVSYVSSGREPLIAKIAHYIQADFAVSGHLHSRYCVSVNDWVVQTYKDFCLRLDANRLEIERYWNGLKEEIMRVCSKEEQARFLTAMEVVRFVPSLEAYRGLWTVSLADLDSGHTLMKVIGGRVALETYSEGRDFGIKKPLESSPKARDQEQAGQSPTPRSMSQDVKNTAKARPSDKKSARAS
eukprot:Ihof_evm4s262 gene=Ihof_evmTU4s262